MTQLISPETIEAGEAAQKVRMRYRTRVEKKLEPYQLAAMLAQRVLTGGKRGQPININGVAIDAATLTAIAKRIAALALKSCNYGLSARDETRWNNLTTQAQAIATDYDLTVTTNGDVRGYVVRLHGKGIYQNGWGDGFGVA